MTNIVETAQRVVERGQYEECEGVLIDLQTAYAITTVAEALSEENAAKFAALGAAKAATVAWKLVSKKA